MQVAVSCSGEKLDSLVDQRFGRTAQFIVYDLDADTFKVIDNAQNLQAAQGAGIQSARTVADSGAKAVITGNVGPKAYRTLNAAGIDIYLIKSGTVKEAIEELKKGNLVKSTGANVDGHWV
jgi:predicted Fe-Mo cluster-binding NifX family protein